MAKRKDLLLKESTVSRMMGLAGIGALTNPFLRESYGEEGMDEIIDPAFKEVDEGYGKDLNEMEEEDEEDPHGGMWPGEVEKMYDDEYNSRFGDEEDEEDEEEDEDEEDFEDEGDEDEGEEELEEGYLEEEKCEMCGKKLHEGSCGGGYMQESIHKSMKRLKRLLEQAEADVPSPAPEGGETPPPEPAPGGGDEMETKIKDFVKKLGELVQETLGVEVTVEEGEGEPEMPEGEAGAPPPPAPAGGAEAPPPAPLAEAINRLVNKVARRVKARLMEAKKKEDPKAKKMMREKQMAAKKKEMEAAKKKKEMMMKKKKAAMAKKK